MCDVSVRVCIYICENRCDYFFKNGLEKGCDIGSISVKTLPSHPHNLQVPYALALSLLRALGCFP